MVATCAVAARLIQQARIRSFVFMTGILSLGYSGTVDYSVPVRPQVQLCLVKSNECIAGGAGKPSSILHLRLSFQHKEYLHRMGLYGHSLSGLQADLAQLEVGSGGFVYYNVARLIILPDDMGMGSFETNMLQQF